MTCLLLDYLPWQMRLLNHVNQKKSALFPHSKRLVAEQGKRMVSGDGDVSEKKL
jgi:hypothetical protein